MGTHHMTHRYREYRGLHGETVRVLAHTIAKTSAHYDRGSYPYVEMAKGLGSDRDGFAQVALYLAPFFVDAIKARRSAPFRAAYRAAQA
jgi:hypothetical protein